MAHGVYFQEDPTTRGGHIICFTTTRDLRFALQAGGFDHMLVHWAERQFLRGKLFLNVTFEALTTLHFLWTWILNLVGSVCESSYLHFFLSASIFSITLSLNFYRWTDIWIRTTSLASYLVQSQLLPYRECVMLINIIQIIYTDIEL